MGVYPYNQLTPQTPHNRGGVFANAMAKTISQAPQNFQPFSSLFSLSSPCFSQANIVFSHIFTLVSFDDSSDKVTAQTP